MFSLTKSVVLSLPDLLWLSPSLFIISAKIMERATWCLTSEVCIVSRMVNEGQITTRVDLGTHISVLFSRYPYLRVVL